MAMTTGFVENSRRDLEWVKLPSDKKMTEETVALKTTKSKPNFRARAHSTCLVFLVLPGGGLLLVDEVLLDHLLLQLADDGVDAHSLLVVRLQPTQPLRVFGQRTLLQLLQLPLQLGKLVLTMWKDKLKLH